MRKNSKILLRLFCATFILSAFTFGGGYVIISLMRKKFVDENKWIGEEEMLDIVAIAQSAPGIIAVNASILTGYCIAGTLGAFVSTAATILPPFIIITAISMFYDTFRDNEAVAAAMQAMQAGIAAVIIDAVIKTGKTAVKGKGLQAFVIIAACFILSYIFNVNTVFIILACGALGCAKALIAAKKEGGQSNDIR